LKAKLNSGVALFTISTIIISTISTIVAFDLVVRTGRNHNGHYFIKTSFGVSLSIYPVPKLTACDGRDRSEL